MITNDVQKAAIALRGNAIVEELGVFLIERRARGLKQGTIDFYREKLSCFADFLSARNVREVDDIRPCHIRRYLLGWAQDHTPGGVHAHYRAIRAFLNWWEVEMEGDRPNPIRQVRAPKVPIAVLEPVSISTVEKMLHTCDGRSFTSSRDRAVLLSLLDTGCRAQEFLDIGLGDVDIGTGKILVRQGKGGKPRSVFLGAKSLRALRRYLRRRQRPEESSQLWLTRSATPLTYSGLREILRRRARRAGVEPPSLHDFRRAFALACLRNGMDVYSLQRLMGHADLTVLRRYLAQSDGDLAKAHRRNGPVDNLL